MSLKAAEMRRWMRMDSLRISRETCLRDRVDRYARRRNTASSGLPSACATATLAASSSYMLASAMTCSTSLRRLSLMCAGFAMIPPRTCSKRSRAMDASMASAPPRTATYPTLFLPLHARGPGNGREPPRGVHEHQVDAERVLGALLRAQGKEAGTEPVGPQPGRFRNARPA